MQEIKCPKCDEVFQVDDSGYATILKQVRDTPQGTTVKLLDVWHYLEGDYR